VGIPHRPSLSFPPALANSLTLKNTYMTFINIFADAYDHFDRVGKSDEMAILIRYAKEELHLSDTDIPSFLMRADFTTITKENYKTTGDFYAWYYVNYVSEIKRSLSFDIHIVGNPHEDTLVPSQRESLGYANLVGEFRSATKGALDVRLIQGDVATTALAYPLVASTLTAGEWNKAAAANNRVEIRLR